MEKMMPESGPFEAILSACFSYMDCCFDSLISVTHINKTIGISFAVSTQDPLQQTVCKTFLQLIGKQTTVVINHCPIDVVVRGINYRLQNNLFSSVELKVENTPNFMEHLTQSI